MPRKGREGLVSRSLSCFSPQPAWEFHWLLGLVVVKRARCALDLSPREVRHVRTHPANHSIEVSLLALDVRNHRTLSARSDDVRVDFAFLSKSPVAPDRLIELLE